MSAQKALQGSETETRELLGGMEENSVSLMRAKIRKYIKGIALKLHVKTTAAAEKEGKFKKGNNKRQPWLPNQPILPCKSLLWLHLSSKPSYSLPH